VPLVCLHGDCDAQEQLRVMDDFRRGLCKVLVATTIVEVGVDVPAATIMVIENAERFGLAQLHQLRGRVGRGSSQGFCFLLMQRDINPFARQRLEYFCANHDGFALADKDLSSRGPGEVSGVRQSGLDDLRFADIIRDAALFRTVLADLDVMGLSA
ncbi:MAG: helicase-related protein, partial [Chitinivibrionales bacterium]|nr:helicase-related protein [Chitinivibrionales bacterium]